MKFNISCFTMLMRVSVLLEIYMKKRIKLEQVLH